VRFPKATFNLKENPVFVEPNAVKLIDSIESCVQFRYTHGKRIALPFGSIEKHFLVASQHLPPPQGGYPKTTHRITVTLALVDDFGEIIYVGNNANSVRRQHSQSCQNRQCRQKTAAARRHSIKSLAQLRSLWRS
jgi:hypothetical protein